MAQLGVAPIVSATTACLVAVGELTKGTTTAIEQAANELLQEGVTVLSVDLRRVASFDEDALDALVGMAARACERGVSVRLCADPATRELLEAAKATALFTAIDRALATAHTVRSSLDVCAPDEGPPPELEAVTWVSTDEPSVSTP